MRITRHCGLAAGDELFFGELADCPPTSRTESAQTTGPATSNDLAHQRNRGDPVFRSRRHPCNPATAQALWRSKSARRTPNTPIQECLFGHRQAVRMTTPPFGVASGGVRGRGAKPTRRRNRSSRRSRISPCGHRRHPRCPPTRSPTGSRRGDDTTSSTAVRPSTNAPAFHALGAFDKQFDGCARHPATVPPPQPARSVMPISLAA